MKQLHNICLVSLTVVCNVGRDAAEPPVANSRTVVQVILEADAIILGAPGRQGGMCGEMRLFLDTWAPHQAQQQIGFGALKVCSVPHADLFCQHCHMNFIKGMNVNSFALC